MRFFIFAILSLFMASAGNATSATDLSFMEGRWTGTYNNLSVISQYIAGNWQVFVGRTFMNDSAGKNQFTELMRVELIQGKLVLTEYPAGSQGASLMAQEITPTSATFVNPQNSNPKKVVYRVSGNVLFTHMEGVENGQPALMDYQQTRIQSQR